MQESPNPASVFTQSDKHSPTCIGPPAPAHPSKQVLNRACRSVRVLFWKYRMSPGSVQFDVAQSPRPDSTAHNSATDHKPRFRSLRSPPFRHTSSDAIGNLVRFTCERCRTAISLVVFQSLAVVFELTGPASRLVHKSL